MREYKMVYHIHPVEGGGQLPWVVEAAHGAGADVVILSEHNVLAGTEISGWQGKVLVIAGVEVSPSYHHYVALNADRSIDGKGNKNPQEFIDEVNRRGGFGFIAHPFFKGKYFILASHRWKNWQARGFTGMEIWNYECDWWRKINFINIWHYCRHPETMVAEPDSKTIKKWDELAAGGRVIGIGALDSQGVGRFQKLGFFQFHYHHRLMKTLRNHLILPQEFSGDSAKDTQTVFTCLKRGNFFIANNELGDATGFSFTAHSTSDAGIMGDDLSADAAELRVDAPVGCFFRIIRNGRIIVEKTGKSIEVGVRIPGAYRVEARLDGRPWVYTNPIWLKNTCSGSSAGR